MKECDHIASRFMDLHEQQVDPATEKLMREHFLACTACREDFKWYGFTVQALSALEDVSPPKDFMAQFESRLYGLTSSSWYSSYSNFFRNLFSSSPYLPLPVGVAALAFIAVFGFSVYNHAPIELLPAGAPLQAHQPPGGASPQSGTVAARDLGTQWLPQPYLNHPFTSVSDRPLSNQIASIPEHPAGTPKSLGANVELSPGRYQTVAERIGGDNLTVESPSVESAVESIKRILPDISGRLVEDRSRGRIDERVIGVVIPPGAYGHLAAELVNHGAVAVGAGSDQGTPAPQRADNNSVMLYIRFVRSQ
ncbi:MAG: hypothetical protein FJY85_09940 [Deltaproteobacteria bacterium]|nr:hypothetical protein [Deltaproteobacteria bacterium]